MIVRSNASSATKKVVTANNDPPPDLVDFIEFGCGSSKPLEFAKSVISGYGYGIDNSKDVVDVCRSRGVEVRLGDVLKFETKNAAAMTFAVDLMPELGGRAEFERAFNNIVQASRNFSVIQHSFFDSDSLYAQAGLQVNGNFSKRIQYKPTIADYVFVSKRLASSSQISGLGLFGLGEPKFFPLTIDETANDIHPLGGIQTFRALRVVVGRKESARFRAGLEKFGKGQKLFIWEKK